MKIDWRKRKVVYSGIEYAMGLGGEESARADEALGAFRSRSMTEQEFEHYYLLGMDLKEMEG